MKFIVHPDGTTWWQPKPNAVIDARDLAGLGIVQTTSQSTGDNHFSLHVYLTGASTDDKREFSYNTLEELNTVLEVLGLKWDDTPDV